MRIFKILTAAQWAEFQRDGVFRGAPIDLSDGYMHFSTAGQVRETAARHFAGQAGLHLAWSDAARLADALKWEVSRGGAKFPHLFRTWQMQEVAGDAPLPLREGRHVFPDFPDEPIA